MLHYHWISKISFQIQKVLYWSSMRCHINVIYLSHRSMNVHDKWHIREDLYIITVFQSKLWVLNIARAQTAKEHHINQADDDRQDCVCKAQI